MDNQQVSFMNLLSIPKHTEYYTDGNGNIISTKRNKIKTLTPHLNYGRSKNPYMRVKVSGKLYLVHRLIASILVGRELYENEYVNHIDGNTQNNSLSNLEIVTHIENVQHAVENKLYCQGKEWYKARNL